MAGEDADYCRGKARVITVNSTYLLAPWADVHYSSDIDWWRLHVSGPMNGEKWTGDPLAAQEMGLKCCPFRRKSGLSTDPGVINWGGNSGFCALQLAFQFGAKRILLIGYDQKDPENKGHWHGEHPETVRRPFNFPLWHKHFERCARDFARNRVQVVNCSRDTALTCFPRAELRTVLC